MAESYKLWTMADFLFSPKIYFVRNQTIVHLSLAILVMGCNAYNLDGRISAVLKAPLTLDAKVLADIPLSNKAVSRSLSAYTSGGSPPYQYTITISGTVQTYMTITLAGDTLMIQRNTSTAMPTTLASLPAMPTLDIKVTDSTGATQNMTGTPQVHLKRVFVTKDIISGDSSLWNTGGTNDYSSCASGDAVEKANCRCNVAAKARGIPGPPRYRAWLSSLSIDASCNLIGSAAKSCVPTQFQGGPWYNMAGNLVAEDIGPGTAKGLLAVDNVTNQALQAAIQYYDDATTAGASLVWGATDATGLYDATNNCSNWAGGAANVRYGNVSGINCAGTAPFWNGGSQACNAASLGFYCFEGD